MYISWLQQGDTIHTDFFAPVALYGLLQAFRIKVNGSFLLYHLLWFPYSVPIKMFSLLNSLQMTHFEWIICFAHGCCLSLLLMTELFF
jgi:hypothetical protein